MKLPHDAYQAASFWGSVFLCGAVVVVGTVVGIVNFEAMWRDEILHDHYAAIVGLPCAAAAAFIIVTLFRQVAGEIKIRGLGFEVDGAGGPVLLWVVCFLALVIALKVIWPLSSRPAAVPSAQLSPPVAIPHDATPQ
jgi:hypothetical protein